MKLMFAGDLHGSAHFTQKVVEAFRREGAQKLILLGDLLYFGPRNPYPQEYDAQRTAKLLNSLGGAVAAVRGNCDSEVDQLLLNFPIRADYMLLYADGVEMFITHGHLYNEETPPPMNPGTFLIHGHTHERTFRVHDDYTCINPGSTSLPKGDGIGGYMVFENGIFTFRDMDGETIDFQPLRGR